MDYFKRAEEVSDPDAVASLALLAVAQWLAEINDRLTEIANKLP